MKKIIVFLVSLFLTACVGIPKLDAPEKLKHDKKVYYQVLHQDLGNIIRYFYVQKTDSLQDWKSAVELLQDRSQPSLTLEQRIALRNKAFSKSHVVRFDVQKKIISYYPMLFIVRLSSIRIGRSILLKELKLHYVVLYNINTRCEWLKIKNL